MQKTAAELRSMITEKDTQSFSEFFEESHPREVAESLAHLEPEEIVQALRLLRKDEAIEVFEFFSESTQAAIFEGFARKEMAELLEEMSPDDRADLVKRLNPELAESVVALMAQVDREDVRRLTGYHEGSAGAIMTTDYAFLPADITVAEALEQLRTQAPDRETIYYIYIVDTDRKLLGVVHLKDLITARPATQKMVKDVMYTDVISVSVDEDPITVARTVAKYDLIAVPVVDQSKRLVGIVTVDDAIDLLDPEAQEATAEGAKRTASSKLGYVDRVTWSLARSRGLWLLGPTFAAIVGWLMIVDRQEDLAIFVTAFGLPMLVALGVAPGTRCAAATARDLVREKPSGSSLFDNILEEMKTGLPAPVLVTSAIAGLLVFRAGGTGHSLMELLLKVGIAATIQVIAAALIGACIALATYRLKLAPESIMSPALITLSDMAGLILYFLVIYRPLVAIA